MQRDGENIHHDTYDEGHGSEYYLDIWNIFHSIFFSICYSITEFRYFIL